MNPRKKMGPSFFKLPRLNEQLGYFFSVYPSQHKQIQPRSNQMAAQKPQAKDFVHSKPIPKPNITKPKSITTDAEVFHDDDVNEELAMMARIKTDPKQTKSFTTPPYPREKKESFKEQVMKMGYVDILSIEHGFPGLTDAFQFKIDVAGLVIGEEKILQFDKKNNKQIDRSKNDAGGLKTFINGVRKHTNNKMNLTGDDKLEPLTDWGEAAQFTKVIGPGGQIYTFYELVGLMSQAVGLMSQVAQPSSKVGSEQEPEEPKSDQKAKPLTTKSIIQSPDKRKEQLPVEITKEKFLAFHDQHINGTYDLLSQGVETRNIADLEISLEEYNEMLINYNKYVFTYLSEEQRKQKRRRENQCVINYSTRDDFMNQLPAHIAKVNNLPIEEVMNVVHILDNAIETYKRQKSSKDTNFQPCKAF
jgi:hypothetical protein